MFLGTSSNYRCHPDYLACRHGIRATCRPVAEPPAAKGWRAETVAGGLPQSLGMAWLADGRMLVTVKKGTLHLVTGKRVHGVRQGPDRHLHALADETRGSLLRIVPQ